MHFLSFPTKEVPKEEFLPKFEDMKVEDISYLTKGEAAGANYCESLLMNFQMWLIKT